MKRGKFERNEAIVAKRGNKGLYQTYIVSLLSLLLCCAMFLSTTFAWFTAEVENKGNEIYVGKLTVDLQDNQGNSLQNAMPIFSGSIKWEPGVMEYRTLRIVNTGDLSFHYRLLLAGGQGERNIGRYIGVYVTNGEVVPADREEIKNNWTYVGTLEDVLSSALPLCKGGYDVPANVFYKNGAISQTVASVTIALHMDSAVNEPSIMGKSLSDIGVKLVATQKIYESDSFGPDYDALANKWDGTVGEVPTEDTGVITITTGAELAAFAASVNDGNTYAGKTVKLGADIDLGNMAWTPIGECNSGKYFQGIFDGQGHRIYNMSVVKSADPNGNSTAGLFGWVDAAGATIRNVKLENATVLGSHWVGAVAGYFTGRIENCSVNNSTIIGFNVNDEANGDKVGGIVGCLNEHSYINNNAVTNTDITGNRDIGGIAGSVAASTYEMKGNKVEDTTLCYSEEKSYASAGAIVSGRTGYVADSTNVATNVEILRVINVKSALRLNEVLAGLSGEALSTAAILDGCNQPDTAVEIPANYTGTLTIKDSVIKSICAGGNANIVIAGDVVVNANGNGVATVAEAESAFNGSAITAKGELHISGNGKLTAVAANVTAAFGIGGMDVTKLTIENVHIAEVKGSYAYGVGSDTKYYKDAPEGGAAIGSGSDGAIITLNNVTVDEAIGGSKAAGIGARYHVGVTVNIINSEIVYIEGGVSAAGIGGSRVSSDATESGTTINIINSVITAKGGAYGAGIGSGYDTHCLANQPLCTINIDGSTIKATGGRYAAGVGTGYHNAALAGEIKNSTVTAVSGEKVYKDTYTAAQDIGFGVVDPAREGQQTASKLIYNGAEIGIPDVQSTN